MASWAEFAAGTAEVGRPSAAHEAIVWEAFEPGARALAEAGERLLLDGPAGINLLATISPAGRPRVHPFMPRVIEGRLLAFIIGSSPKARDLERRPYTLHTPPTAEDEEFWVSGRAKRVTDAAVVEQIAGLMEWAQPDVETLFEFDLERAGWTTWLDFGTPNHRPQHHRWVAA